MDFKKWFKRGRIGFVTRDIFDMDGGKSMLFYEVEEIKKGEKYSKIKVKKVTGLYSHMFRESLPTILETNEIKWLD